MGPSEAREGCSGEERGTGEGRAEHHEVSPTQGKESRVLRADEGCELCNLRLVGKSLCLYLVF